MSNNKWLDFAIDDLDSSGIMLREGKYNNVCYFSHQAVEKALKGYLENNNIVPPRIHDLIELLNQCKNINPDFAQFIQQVRLMNQFYIPTRYPVAPAGSLPNGTPDRTIAIKASSNAERIVDYCKTAIK